MKISNNTLYGNDGKQVAFIQSPNKDGNLVPQYLIMHYTESTSAASTISWFQEPSSKVSAHLLIGRDGTITQFVRFNVVAWHAGESTWDGLLSLNKYSIGIELVNAGRLSRSGDSWVCAVDSKVIPADQVLIAQHKNETFNSAWQTYTEVQLNTAAEVGKLLFTNYNLTALLGHEDIAPGRKVDPGPAFPLESMRTVINSSNFTLPF